MQHLVVIDLVASRLLRGEVAFIATFRKWNCMTPKYSNTLIILGLAAVLWVVPSLGTQGMGTIGQRFSHPDAALADGRAQSGTTPAVRATLQRADVAVESALGD